MNKKNYLPFSVRTLALGQQPPKICVPLVAKNTEELQKQLDMIKASPHDLVEWRADHLEGGAEPQKAVEVLSLIREELGEDVLLFTFRTRPEGGEQEAAPEVYASICRAVSESGLADLIDVEYHMGEDLLRTLIPDLKKNGTGVICSCHDFAETPGSGEMLEILKKMQGLGADVTKLAVMPQSKEDVLRLLAVSVEMEETCADRPFITMSMGRLGALTRLAGSLDGSALTFASAGRASAPGQMSAEGVRAALSLLE